MVRWNNILTSKANTKAVVSFVEGKLPLRSFQKTLNVDARNEFAPIANRGTDHCKTLARKALRQRKISYTVSN